MKVNVSDRIHNQLDAQWGEPKRSKRGRSVRWTYDLTPSLVAALVAYLRDLGLNQDAERVIAQIPPTTPVRLTDGRHPVDDPRGNWNHGTNDPNEVYSNYLSTFRAWLALQPNGTDEHYCKHGKYVGGKRALAYACPFCPEV
jgi:hypothetical protein